MKAKIIIGVLFLFFSLTCLAIPQDDTLELSPQEYTQEEQENNINQENTQIIFPKTASQSKISLDIKGMDIIDVLKMLATRSGMNIVIGKNVTGKVTLFLKEVDILDAFDIILAANDLAFEKKGGILNVVTQRDYELLYGERYQDKKQVKVVQLKYAKAADLARALAQIKTNIGKIVVDEASNTVVLIDTQTKINEMEGFISGTDLPVRTKVFNLNYAQADKLSPKIQDSITKGVGVIKIDERTNKIVITDYPEKLEEIAKVIKAFDEKTPQVLIDSQIIEIRPSDKFEMGIDWDFWIKKNFKIAASLPVGTNNRLLLGTTSSAPSEQGNYKAVLDLLRTIGETKILSSPRITALNNQEAKILVGTKDAYITSTTSQSGETAVTSQSVNFVDVGIKLYVTPTVNRDGFVTMKIKPEISSAERTNLTSEGQITQVPIVTTSEIETSIVVKDGVTIIIGGLRKDEKTKTVKKIPLLGDIPFLGVLFKSTLEELKNTELVVLLTPHVISGENSFTEFSDIKPKDGAVLSMSGGNIVAERVINIPGKQSYDETGLGYYKSVVEKVKALALFVVPEGQRGEVEVGFTLNSKGEMTDGPKIISSSNQNLNQKIIDTIKDIPSFSPFPDNLNKPEENFRVSLEYK